MGAALLLGQTTGWDTEKSEAKNVADNLADWTDGGLPHLQARPADRAVPWAHFECLPKTGAEPMKNRNAAVSHDLAARINAKSRCSQ